MQSILYDSNVSHYHTKHCKESKHDIIARFDTVKSWQSMGEETHKDISDTKDISLLLNMTTWHDRDFFASPQNNKTPNFTIKTLKESFLKTGRLDSEYYQIKYEEIEKKIKDYKGGCVKLQIAEIKDSNFMPKAMQTYHYIELSNIGANGAITKPLEQLGKDLPTRARRLVKEGDLIISSIEGSLSSCALITKEFDSYLVSTGFYVIRAKNMSSETLLVLFKSQFFQEYLKKFPSGTILMAISKEELQNILIPIIDSKIQDSIASYIQKSFDLRKEAKDLLNEAKAKVESAISGGQNSSFVALEIFRIYYLLIKAKIKAARKNYRLGEWLLLKELLFNQIFMNDSKAYPCQVQNYKESNTDSAHRDISLVSQAQYDNISCQVKSQNVIARFDTVKSWQSMGEETHRDISASPQNNKTLNFTIKTLKESFLKTGRLDSEYYQDKYAKNERVIKTHSYARLIELVNIKKSIEPGSKAYQDSGIAFVRVGNLSQFGISKSEVYLDSKDFSRKELEHLFPKKDSILFSKDDSVGIAYCMDMDREIITSGAILHLVIKDKARILPQYLALVLNALTTKLQAQRDSGGSIIAHWKTSEIENILIPLVDITIQQKIEAEILQSFALRTKSKELLEKAKQRVEEVINKP